MLWVPTASKAVSKVAVRAASSVAVPKVGHAIAEHNCSAEGIRSITFWPGDVNRRGKPDCATRQNLEGVAVRAVLVG